MACLFHSLHLFTQRQGPPYGRGSWIAINDELEGGTAVQIWKSPEWYDPDNGQVVCVNMSGILRRGHSALTSDGWYLTPGNPGAKFLSSGIYLLDPATNKTCTYKQGSVEGGTGGKAGADARAGWVANCTCTENGNATNTTPHSTGR
jgi:hypothetical protein